MPTWFHQYGLRTIQNLSQCTPLQPPTRAEAEPLTQEVSGGDHVARTELTKKQSLWGFKGDTPVNFIRIVTIDARNLPKVRDKYTPSPPNTPTLSFPTRLRKGSMFLPRFVRRRCSDFRKQHRIYPTVHD